MCYAVRVGTEGEVFTDASEARDRYFALQNAGLSPGFIIAPSLARCLAWIEQTPGERTIQRLNWEEQEDYARRQRVASQQQQMGDRERVLDALQLLRAEDSDGSDVSDVSRTTEDLQLELGARDAFGSRWREVLETESSGGSFISDAP
jgi:hypothetical protein